MAWSALNKPADNKGASAGKPLNKPQPSTPYVLVLLDSAKGMPEGTEKAIDAAYISLGRESDCSICYGDDFPMVSRLHAAIEWSEDGYSLRHLSNTNQTLLNGRPIGRKWFLHDDDVIQLAPSGPKIKFKMPLILNMKPSADKPAKSASVKSVKKNPTDKKIDVHNIAMISVIVLGVLLAILMVYLTVWG